MALLLQINNQHCYILTKKSPDFTVGFTFMLYVLWIFSNAEWHVSTTITSHRISFITPKSQCSHYSSLSLLPHLATTGLFNLHIFCTSAVYYLHFLDDIWCRVSFHMLIDHLYVFFGEMSVQIFFPLYNGFVLLLNFTSALSVHLKSLHHIQVYIGYSLSSRNFMVCAL